MAEQERGTPATAQGAVVVELQDPFRRHRREVAPLDVLIVDEQQSTLLLVEALLMKAGHRAFAYSDPERALEYLVDVRVDLVILDSRLPQMSGADFTNMMRMMRAGTHQTPVIFLTADKSSMVMREAREAGVLRVLHKPLQPSVLLDALADVSAAARAAAAARTAASRTSQLRLLREEGIDDHIVAEYARRALDDIETYRRSLETATCLQDAQSWTEACESIHSIAIAIDAQDLAAAAGKAMNARDAGQRLFALRSLDQALEVLRQAEMEPGAFQPA